MTFGLQLYGPIACRQMDFAPLMRGVKRLGYGLVEPCVDLDGSKNNPSFWPMAHVHDKFAIINEAGLEVLSCHVAAENLLRSLPNKDFVMSNPADTDVCIGDGTLDDAEKSLHYLESLI